MSVLNSFRVAQQEGLLPSRQAVRLHQVSARTTTSPQIINNKRHIEYFRGYFETLNAQTIIVEHNYIDRDFLEDFASYYVRCFQDYDRKCRRFHFFSASFDETAFHTYLTAQGPPLTSKILGDCYLGFVVVKPLPMTVIGRTCLQTYPAEGRRFFPIQHIYDAHLFGLHLTVSSLAFQEQDTVAAACATSALWSAFHGTSRHFQHHIPSPVEITKSATVHNPLGSRTFPNVEGLTGVHMADAIRSVGLEPYQVNVGDEFVLKDTVYAYLRGHIPVLFIMKLVNYGTIIEDAGDSHAVTVVGYNLESDELVPYDEIHDDLSDDPPDGSPLYLRAFRMDKIYVHDDQIGPFARMECMSANYLSTSWLDDKTGGPLAAKVEVILIPLYHKIRIPLQTIFDIVVPFNNRMEKFREEKVLTYPEPLEWDIYLSNPNDLKAELLDSNLVVGDYRSRILTQSMPRFIWRCTALCENKPILDLIFDATDIEQGKFLVCAIEYDREISRLLRIWTPNYVQYENNLTRFERLVLEWFANPKYPNPFPDEE